MKVQKSSFLRSSPNSFIAAEEKKNKPQLSKNDLITNYTLEP